MNDEVGNEIKVGDTVRITALWSSHGAHLFMTDHNWEVVGIGRSRIEITNVNYLGTRKVNPEYVVKVVKAVDGRTLRTWADAHAKYTTRLTKEQS